MVRLTQAFTSLGQSSSAPGLLGVGGARMSSRLSARPGSGGRRGGPSNRLGAISEEDGEDGDGQEAVDAR